MNITNEVILEIVTQAADKIFNLPSVDESSVTFTEAEPYSYLVIDNFLSPKIIEHIDKYTKSEPENFSKKFTDEFQNNKTISTGEAVPQLVKVLSTQFASSEILRYFEKITGLGPLIPDPHYNTEYGYYHILKAGGVLGSHVDHSRHHVFGFPHVLNLVIYLTKDWKPEFGGALCLYDASGKRVIKRIECLYNRAVLFMCHPTAYHGVEPVTSSINIGRHSLYFAYYTVQGQRERSCNSGQEVGQKAVPSRRVLSNTDEAIDYPTTFVIPYISLLKPRNWVHLRPRLVSLFKNLTPPFIIVILKSVMHSINRRV